MILVRKLEYLHRNQWRIVMKVKRILLIVSTLLWLAPFAFAQAGTLKVSDPSIDYGTIKEGPPVIKKILLTNTGNQKLTIANVTTS